MNQFFDKIYCINLDRRSDKWERCEAQYSNMNVEVQRISGVDGRDVHDVPFPTRPGHYGCLMSHLKILEDAQSNNYGSILILEDDAAFSENYLEVLEKAMKDLPDDWNMFYLSANNVGEKIPVTDSIYRATRLLTTHAYAINSNFYERLISEIHKNKLTKNVDVIYANIMHESKVYLINPYISWQIEGYSDILNRVTNNEKYTRE